MPKCRNFHGMKKDNIVNSLTEIVSENAYGFTENIIDQDSIDLIKKISMEYLERICRTHRISEDMIKTINVIVTPDEKDNSQIELYVDASDELLELFSDLGIQ